MRSVSLLDAPSVPTATVTPASSRQRSAILIVYFLWQPRQPLCEELVEARVVGAAEVEHVLRPIGDLPVVGDRHAAGQLAHRLDSDVDLPPVEQAGLEEPGDDARIVERGA